MKNSLTLVFSSKAPFELLNTTFESAFENREIHAVRGNDHGAYDAQGTFKWSNGVKALCCMFLAAKLQHHILLKGEQGSYAVTLDNAISRNAQWLVDIFGSDKNGNTGLRRLVKRSNSGRKRPGPVVFSLNANIFNHSAITIKIDNRILASEEDIKRLLNALSPERTRLPYPQSSLQEQSSLSGLSKTVTAETLPFPLNTPLTKKHFETAVRNEVSFQLSCREKLIENTLIRRYTTLSELPELTLLTEKMYQLLHNSLTLLQSTEIQKAPQQKVISTPVTVFMPGVNISFYTLLTFLRSYENIPLAIDYHFPDGITLYESFMKKTREDAPEVILSGLGPALNLVNDLTVTRYQPVLFGPSISHELLTTHESNNSFNTNALHFPFEFSTTSACLVGEHIKTLQRYRLTSPFLESLKVREIASLMSQDNNSLQTILWFPLYYFIKEYTNAKSIPLPLSYQERSMETVILLRDDFADSKEGKDFLLALYQAWIVLSEPSPVLTTVLDTVLSDFKYLKALLWISGCYGIRVC